MARNLTQQGYPSSTEGMKRNPISTRPVKVAEGTASAKKTEPLGDYMRGESDELDDNRQQDYINALLDKVKSPIDVNRWNSRLNITNADWQDSIHKGYSLNTNDGTRLGLVQKTQYPSGLHGTNYSAVVDNLEPILGDAYGGWYSGDTPLGSVGVDYEDGSLGLSYNTPSLKDQIYYVNALKNLLRR